jgi:SAM-dependent methyltransferase
MTYAGAEFWDQFYRQRRESGDDLDWGGLWTAPFLVPLREAGAQAILELGCGTGNDTGRLAGEGYAVTAVDLSAEAIGLAAERFGSIARFVVADAVTRAVFTEVGRVVRPGGLFLFHVNAIEDRPLRARRLPARELEPDFVVEESGQTMHFFSEAYLRDLLAGWQEVQLTAVSIPNRKTGELYKQVWRGIARR